MPEQRGSVGEGRILTILSLLIFLKANLVSAEFCQSERASWQCACGCCDDYDFCCVSCASYWYAWLLIALIFFLCLCGCLGCGSYGYRRYRPLSTSQSVIRNQSPRYGTTVVQPSSSSDTRPLIQPTTYQPSAATMATGHQNYRQPNNTMGYYGYPTGQTPSDMPPPYNPNQPPPPYSSH